MNIKPPILFLSILAAMSIFAANGQSPIPVLVPAASAAAGAPSSTAVNIQDSDTLQATIKVLVEMKAANEEMLKKQEMMLQQLDDLQKAAEQLKIFSKRG